MVLDGVEGKQYDTAGFHTFSPDSKHLAYAARVGDKCFVVLDGVEGKQYDLLEFLTFSPDSNHIAYAAKEGNKGFVVVDGVEGKQHELRQGVPFFRRYPGLILIGGIVFESSDSFRYIVLEGAEVYLVEEKIR